MRVAALVGLLAVGPAGAGEPVTPAQARASVVAALPPDIAKNAGKGDLQVYLQRLTPEQRKAALRSLAAKEGELGDDPATLAVIGQAYAGLGELQKVREAAEAVRRQDASNPDAKRLLLWVDSQERLAGHGSQSPDGTKTAGGPAPGPGSAQARLNEFEQRVQSFFQRGRKSPEFRSVLNDAHGLSVPELKARGFQFTPAEATQPDAVKITPLKGGGMSIAIRDDALIAPGEAKTPGADVEARGAAHVAGGVKQAQTLKEYPNVGWLIVKARGWISTGKTHRELAPNDADPRPTSPSDQNLMIARKIVDRENYHFDSTKESYCEGMGKLALGQLNRKSTESKLTLEELFIYFLDSHGRGNGN